MVRKFFPLDKNYLLKEAQLTEKATILANFVERVKENYRIIYNPLGLEDDTIRRINTCSAYPVSHLDEFYDHLCAIYRFEYGENQLEFLWDGTSHFEQYQKDWEEMLNQWVDRFCQSPNFVKAVFELTIFWHDGVRPQLAQNRLKTFINQHFAIKVYRYKGIQKSSA